MLSVITAPGDEPSSTESRRDIMALQDHYGCIISYSILFVLPLLYFSALKKISASHKYCSYLVAYYSRPLINVFPSFSPFTHVVGEFRCLVCLETISMLDVTIEHAVVGIAKISPQSSDVGGESGEPGACQLITIR
jgi:hypothetical protein